MIPNKQGSYVTCPELPFVDGVLKSVERIGLYGEEYRCMHAFKVERHESDKSKGIPTHVLHPAFICVCVPVFVLFRVS
jgi:hypothetical protein